MNIANAQLGKSHTQLACLLHTCLIKHAILGEKKANEFAVASEAPNSFHNDILQLQLRYESQLAKTTRSFWKKGTRRQRSGKGAVR